MGGASAVDGTMSVEFMMMMTTICSGPPPPVYCGVQRWEHVAGSDLFLDFELTYITGRAI